MTVGVLPWPAPPDDYYSRWYPPAWTEQALCAQVDPDLFFPDKGDSPRQAKRICAGCEVRADCLAEALDRGERWGVWGGLSERERRALRRRNAA